MYPKSNLHTHTTFCDGTVSPDSMVRAAIDKGIAVLGFSGHAHMTGPGEEWSMSVSGSAAYRAAVTQLKRDYSDQIEIALGIEQDVFSDAPTDGYDYVIGAAHFVIKDGESIPIDHSAAALGDGVNNFYHGDIYALIENFYELVAQIPEKTGADIIAHFDLVKKFNAGGAMFDENDPRYRDASITALLQAAKSGAIFEINTGGAYRGGNPEFYMSPTLLKELKSVGGRITFSSDSHDVRSLCYKFPEAKKLAKLCGFKTAWTWSGGEFREFKI